MAWQYYKIQWILVLCIHMLMVKTHNTRERVFSRLLQPAAQEEDCRGGKGDERLQRTFSPQKSNCFLTEQCS